MTPVIDISAIALKFHAEQIANGQDAPGRVGNRIKCLAVCLLQELIDGRTFKFLLPHDLAAGPLGQRSREQGSQRESATSCEAP